MGDGSLLGGGSLLTGGGSLFVGVRARGRVGVRALYWTGGSSSMMRPGSGSSSLSLTSGARGWKRGGLRLRSSRTLLGRDGGSRPREGERTMEWFPSLMRLAENGGLRLRGRGDSGRRGGGGEGRRLGGDLERLKLGERELRRGKRGGDAGRPSPQRGGSGR
ncbi:hypothetical protein DFH09DRAFT_1120458 [Mycena vulgaris]|nr:hypothetical protein DFH09DRAFT_1120458 [Mycena vulgaris]